MVTVVQCVQYQKMRETRAVCMYANRRNRNEMKIEFIFIERRRNGNQNEDTKINSKVSFLTANKNHAMKESQDSRSAGGGVFCCIILIILIKLFLLFTILLWRIFDIDILDRGYDQRTNNMIFNITDYIRHRHYRP